MQSLDIIQELLKRIDPQSPICTETASFSPNQIAVSIVEGARGRVLHIAKSKDESTALWYKIYDPSMVNWLALSLAVQDEQVSDFPLCNKSLIYPIVGVTFRCLSFSKPASGMVIKPSPIP
jgi:Ni,Fe-hydrogenase III large subunit